MRPGRGARGLESSKSCSRRLHPRPLHGRRHRAGALITPLTIEAARSASNAKGLLDGRELAKVFAWMRPNDLIWNYWVSNYLLGNAPPAFDILFWNNDTTSLPARLHSDYLDLIKLNPFRRRRRAEPVGNADRHGQSRRRHLCGRRRDRSHNAVEIGLSIREDPRRGDHICSVQRRASAEPDQSARESEGDIRDRQVNSVRPGGLCRRRGEAIGKLVAHWSEWLSIRSEEKVAGALGARRPPCSRPREPAPGTYVFNA